MPADVRRAWRHFWSKPASERFILVRGLLRRLRDAGPTATMRYVRSHSTAYDEAARYLQWCAQHTPTAEDLGRMARETEKFRFQPLISILTAVYNTEQKWLEACADSVIAQAYPRWEWQIANDGSTRPETLAALERIAKRDRRVHVHHLPVNRGISAASNVALSAAQGDYVALLDHDDALLPHALFSVVEAFNQTTARPDVVYSDEDKLDLDGRRCDAYFKPDWSPDLFLSSMFVCHLLVARRALVNEVGGFRSPYDFSQDYDLMLRLMEKAQSIRHVPDVLYHWRKIPQSAASAGEAKPTAQLAAQRALQDYLDRNGIAGHIEVAGPLGLHRVRYHVTGKPLVSIVMPTRGEHATRLSATLKALDATTRYRQFEIVVVSGDGRVPADAATTLAPLKHRLVRATSDGFNLSACLNTGAAAARGRHILVLHDDVEPIEEGWLESMLELSEQAAIGAVGAKLYYPHGALQHTGLVLGLNGLVGRPFQGHNADTVGYYSGAICIRNYSAVSGTCLMTRRDVFERLGGFDEQLPLQGGDIDYCLKVGSAGLRVVFTPYAPLVHYETGGVSAQPVAPSHIAHLRARWGDRLERDPFYNPNLTREYLDYRVAV